MLYEHAKAIGHLKVFTSPKGQNDWTKVVDQKNTIVNLGLNLERDNVFGTQTNYVQWGAVSDDNGAVVAGDTSLTGNEIRKAFQYTDLNTQSQFFGEYFISATEWLPAGITGIEKAGLYFKSAGAFLWNAATFTIINVDETVDMLVQWTVDFSN